MESRHPGITKNVVSDEDVRYLGSLETPVKEVDTTSLPPAVTGGRT